MIGLGTAYDALRARMLALSTRDYKARGILAIRCERCQLKQSHCICKQRPDATSAIEFVLIMHRDELFKPTNTGRLIADCFAKTHAFLWDRLSPDPALLDLLADPARQCLIIFPADENGERPVFNVPPSSEKTVTLILLDGTWKQGRRMYNLSPWLQHLPALRLNPAEKARYSTRVAAHDNYLSTAESAALALALAGETVASGQLFEYFALFDRHYAAMRKNVAVSSSTDA